MCNYRKWGIVLIAILATASAASAVTKTWNVNSGNWNVSGNWNPSGIPSSSDEVNIVRSGATCTIPSGCTAYPYRMYVYYAGSAPTLNIASGGVLNINAGSVPFLKVGFGNNADGYVYQNGTVSLTNGADLLLGDGSGSSYTTADGYYYLQAGVLTVDALSISERKGYGRMVQSAGSVSAGLVSVGYDTLASNALYSMTGGSLVCTGLAMRKGSFEQARSAFVDVNGALTVAAAAKYKVQIASTSDYSKILAVSGNITLTSGCTLQIEQVGYRRIAGNEMMLLSTTGAISGTFTNVPSGWTTELRNSNRELWLRATTTEPICAFPGAEGAGKWSTGGRGGDVYHVTNLNNDGAGSLRYGITSATGARTIVFDLGGTIAMTSRMDVNKSNLTIAGETAPGGGICVRNGAVSLRGNNIIIRNIRFRLGDNCGGDYDTLDIYNGTNCIIDHCSVSWSIDECMSVTADSNYNTIQWCIISESLDDSIHSEGPHGCGSLFKPDIGSYLSVHHCLYASHADRAPAAGSYNGTTLHFDFRDNVVYNWDSTYAGYNSTGDDTCKMDMNYISNYLIEGPQSSGAYAFSGSQSGYCDIYQSGNYMDSDRDSSHDGSAGGWGLFTGAYDDQTVEFDLEDVTTQTAPSAYTAVLAGAGAIKPSRDSVDTRIVSGVTNRSGAIINDQDSVGGWPTLATGTAPTDTDGDGMSDTWETANGTNAAVDDNNGDVNGDGYTNLENYLHSKWY